MLIILGSNGMLGSYISSFFSKQNHCIVSITRSDFDIDTHDFYKLINILKDALSSTQDDSVYLINCIGLIPQKCDLDLDNSNYMKDKLNLINGYFPIYLYSLCKMYNIFYIHPSTDCVFSGKNGPYNEYDHYNIIDDVSIMSLYRDSKLISDNFLQNHKENCCIIRTSIIGRQFVSNILSKKLSLLEWVISSNDQDESHTICGYKNVLWNGITCLEYSKFLYYYINNNCLFTGLKHIYSPTTLDFSKYELLKLIKTIYNLDKLDIIEICKNNEEYICNKHLHSVKQISPIYPIQSLTDQLQELKEYIF
jgi:dTDP-4-dehydrorhamnose reductase